MGIFNPKKSILLFFIIVIMLNLAFVSLTIPKANAIEPTIVQKGEAILSNVMGLDLQKYSIATNIYPVNESMSSNAHQENVIFRLNSDNSNLKVLFTFANGNLQIIQVLEKQGTPSMEKIGSTGIVEKAKSFLDNYQPYTGNSLFGELKSTIEGVDDQSLNITKTYGNKVLQVTNYHGYNSFRWYYTYNSVNAEYSKSISLVFQNGFLSSFVDNWQFYSIGSTQVNVSKEEAIATALDITKAHISSLVKFDLETNNINQSNIRWTSLIFDGSQNADNKRSEDSQELYPVWRVGVALDKWYGSMYGVQVDIWADTGQIRRIEDAWSTMPPPDKTLTANNSATEESSGSLANETQPVISANNQSLLTDQGFSGTFELIAVSTCILTLTTFMLFVKRKAWGLNAFSRRLKTAKRMILVLILSAIILAPIATVGASTGKAVIWGSESAGATGFEPPFGPSWRKSSSEVAQQRITSKHIQNYLQSAGYNAFNNQGENGTTSYKDNILDDIETYCDFNNRAVFLDFDHGNGNNYLGSTLFPYVGEFHFIFEDQNGTYVGDYYNRLPPFPPKIQTPQYAVYDKEIYDGTTEGTTLLAFISTCNSASLVNMQNGETWQGMGSQGARGMPYAFTHGRAVTNKELWGSSFDIASHMSDDGFFYPDDGNQVFIGFIMGSPSLSQNMPLYGGVHQYYEWVEKFFQYASMDDISVNAALNQASNDLFTKDFADPSNPLRSFDAYWWMGSGQGQYGDGYMAIYGNGRIQLNGNWDDFDDGNYNGWTVLQGSWSASTGQLGAQQGTSLIRTNEEFTTDRFVRTRVKTTSSEGPNSWDVAWVMAKYADNNNKVYGLIHKNGIVELCIVRNGQQYVYSTTSSLSPSEWHTLDINIVGNNAWLWVDGALKKTVTSDYLDDFEGYSGLFTGTSTQALFDDLTVIEQSFQPKYARWNIKVIEEITGQELYGIDIYRNGFWIGQTPLSTDTYVEAYYYYADIPSPFEAIWYVLEGLYWDYGSATTWLMPEEGNNNLIFYVHIPNTGAVRCRAYHLSSDQWIPEDVTIYDNNGWAGTMNGETGWTWLYYPNEWTFSVDHPQYYSFEYIMVNGEIYTYDDWASVYVGNDEMKDIIWCYT